jgi:hypothetical protein
MTAEGRLLQDGFTGEHVVDGFLTAVCPFPTARRTGSTFDELRIRVSHEKELIIRPLG